MNHQSRCFFTHHQGYDSIYDGIYNENIVFIDEDECYEEFDVDDEDESEEYDEDDAGYCDDIEDLGGYKPGNDVVNGSIITVIDYVPNDRIPSYVPTDSTIPEA